MSITTVLAAFSLCPTAPLAVRTPSFRAAVLSRMSSSVPELRRAFEDLCESMPDNGVGATLEQQEAITSAIVELEPHCTDAPARVVLSGTYELLYCSAKGGSNGKVGPLVGKVTQTFVDDTQFINAVSFFGDAVRLSLYATREVLDDTRIRVTFQETGVQLWGTELFRKTITGSGVWKQKYVSESGDLRVMLTPSVFVLRRAT